MIILKPGKERRLMAGHCWVYAGEISQISEEAKDGDAVEIRDQRKRCLGVGLLNTKSQITVRRFTTQKEVLDEAFFRRRLEAAIAYRRGKEVCRLVFSKGDQLPGLIVDRFGDVLVLQALTLGIDQRKNMIVKLLRELCRPRAVVERSDVPSRRLEGLDETKGVLWGECADTLTLPVGGLSFETNLLDDQKTGFFLDQAENYQTVASLCTGKRVLDCFSYHGGFALFAARAGAASVEAVEISEPAVFRARQNTELNGLTGKVEFNCANAFDVLKKYDTEKRQFDVIILDPPTFTRTKANVAGAMRGYKEISLRSLKMLPVGGVLAVFSCSHHVSAEMLMEVVVDAAADAKKTVRLLRALSQSADHPILPAVPETEYLKGFLLQVV
jgi:23S rRNA (cytosine1962-C5)-methyltransferase